MDNLLGIAVGDWAKLLRENNFAIDRPYISRAVKLSFRSLLNSNLRKKENKKWGQEIKNTKIEKDPIFILGHWRSGTTLLHNYLTVDEQFGYPTLLQISNPHSFLTLEPMIKKGLEKMNDKKRPMDNVQINYSSPGEEAFAVSIMSLKSPLIGWSFPRRAEYYDKYLTMDDVSVEELDKWRLSVEYFIKKITFVVRKQLVLKSPTNTAVIKNLLRIFPNAKFVHIHRNPFRVFASTLKLYNTAVALSHLQRPPKNVEDRIIMQYDLLYSAYLRDVELLQQDNLVEISYRQLTDDPVKTIEHIYKAFHINGFEKTKAVLEEKVRENGKYKNNTYSPLPDHIVEKIQEKWSKYFHKWGYPLDIQNKAHLLDEQL